MNDTKLLVKQILQASAKEPMAFQWSIQGLGMLRLYLSEDTRMHVWSRIGRIPDVSPLHTHPWSFNSYVVAGNVVNKRYKETPGGDLYNRALITCGANAKVEETDQVTLKVYQTDEVGAGQTYTQWSSEIHESLPEEGTVTMVQRHFGADREHAYVFWKDGDFVSAEPRRAQPVEVTTICTMALAKHF